MGRYPNLSARSLAKISFYAGFGWCLFREDSLRFIVSSWALRAIELGWEAAGLFGSQFERPHEHLESAGLLWNLGGGQIVHLHRDGAALLMEDGRARTFHRRRDQTLTFLPWR